MRLRLLDEIDERGGAVACIESGWMQQLIQDEAYRTERAIAVGDKVIVGVNRYTETEEAGAPLLFRPDERAMAEQAHRLARTPRTARCGGSSDARWAPSSRRRRRTRR